MPVETKNKERVRTLLKKANVEIGTALGRVDEMGEYELAEAAGAAEATRAFFDFNGSCGASSVSDTQRGAALVNALRDIMR